MKTDEQILSISREILSSDGLGALTFDAIARRLGRSKQAVLYWFPTKPDLLAALFLPWLDAEAEAATAAVARATTRTDALATFIRAITDFHLADLDRFRLMYLAPQTTRHRGREPDSRAVLQRVPPVTSRIYDALTPHLGTDSNAARQKAVAVHAASLGLILMISLADAVNDPLKHSASDLVEALILSLASQPISQES